MSVSVWPIVRPLADQARMPSPKRPFDEPPASPADFGLGAADPAMKPGLKTLLWSGVLGLLAGCSAAPKPVLRVVKSAPPGTPLLRNGGFEETEEGKLTLWRGAPNGFRLVAGEGRNSSRALVCENLAGEGWWGASQTLMLSRTEPARLVVRGWSKAFEASGSPDNGYSLYADVVFADDTTLWGQCAQFACGTHDWEPRELILAPEKPVKSVSLYCMFRGHTGKVWFDDVSVEEVQPQPGVALYQGARVALTNLIAKPRGRVSRFATQDGLELTMRDTTVTSLRVQGRELAATTPGGFLVRDVATNSDFYSFAAGACPALGLTLKAECSAQADHLVVQGRLTDTTQRDRAVTLVFALPLDAQGWNWADDLRRHRVIGGQSEYSQTTTVPCGATGTLSLYPVGAVYHERAGLALALDLAKPAQYRLGYHAGTRQLLIAYDFGLAPDTANFPGGADFRFIIYQFDPRWGFRAAWDKFMRLSPEPFLRRSQQQGIWMPFTDISTVQGWEDFGFRYHEGDNNVRFDDEHGILSFRYTEPMTWWMAMPKESPRALAEALRLRDELAQGTNEPLRRLAQVSETAAMRDERDQPSLLFREEPWCHGAVWSLNPNPYLPGATNAATIHWNEAVKQRLYGVPEQGQLDGEYLDSLEGYVTADLNHRRDHFPATTVPLVFARETQRLALFKGLAVYEFTRWLADQVHQLGKLTFANGVPFRFTFLCPWLDVMGTETDWLRQGEYHPADDTQMCLWRTLAGAKPYLLLMNTDYDRFTPELVERYFERCLFYGVFPSMFSHNAADNPYWQNPKWYERDRPLFKRYQPLIRRVAEAGWQPLTQAVADNPNLWVERFGPGLDGAVYLTVFNDTHEPQSGALRADLAALRLAAPMTVREALSGRSLDPASPAWSLSLAPQHVAVIEARPQAATTPPP